MAKIQFEWDEAKNLANQCKHGLSFKSALQVFRDPLGVTTLERTENGEERWQTFGLIVGVLWMAVHTIQEEMVDGDVIEVIRIISARRAEKHERRRYGNENS